MSFLTTEPAPGNTNVAQRRDQANRQERVANFTNEVNSSNLQQAQKNTLLYQLTSEEADINDRRKRFQALVTGTNTQAATNETAIKQKNETPGRAATILTRNPGILG